MAKEENAEKKIVVDQDACIGCGTCEGIAGNYFKLSVDEKKSQVIKEYDEADKDIIEDAIASCPVGAISLK